MPLIGVAFIGGVLAVGYIGLFTGTIWSWVGWWFLVGGAVVAICGLTLRRQRVIVPIIILAFLIGLIRGSGIEDPSAGWVNIPDDGERIIARGALLQDATRGSGNDFLLRISVDNIRVDSDVSDTDFVPANFLLFVYTERISTDSGRVFDEFRYGDYYEVSGTFRRAEPDFDFAGSLNTPVSALINTEQGNPFRRQLATIRETISQQFTNILPADVAGLAAALTVGDRKRLDADITGSFRLSGLAHLLAISGFHIALVGGTILGFSTILLGKRFGVYLIIAFVGVWSYAILAGLSPSVTRAAIMFSVFLLARSTGRQNSILPSISLAAIIMVMIDPAIIMTVSFQLSFVAVLGIALITKRVSRFWHRIVPPDAPYNNAFLRLVSYIVLGMSASISATLAVAPIVGSIFGQTTLAAPLTTLMASPVLPFLTFPLFVAAAASWIWTPLGSIIAFPAIVSAEYLITVATFFASIEWLTIIYDDFPLYIALIWYPLIGVVLFHHSIRRGITAGLHRIRHTDLKSAPVLATIALVLVSLWVGLVTVQEENYVTVHFPQTSVGDLIVIETPSGFQAIIDGARRRDEAVEALDEFLPFWDRTVNLVVLTHHDADHIGGLAAVIDRYNVDYVLNSNAMHDSLLAQEWDSKLSNLAADGEIDVQRAVDGMIIDFGDGVQLEVIWSGASAINRPINDASTVMKLTYQQFSVLLTGDITEDIENLLVATEENLNSTVLKVAHHGSNTSSTANFLEAVQPSIAVIQAGNSNPFGHPTDEVVDRIARYLPPNSADSQLLVTKDKGDITIRSDGQRVWIETSGVAEQN